MQVPAPRGIGLKVLGSLERQCGFVGGSEISRSTQQPGDVSRQRVEHFTRGVSSRHALAVGRKNGKPRTPSSRQLAPLHLIDLAGKLGIFRLVGRQQLAPAIVGLCPTAANSGGKVIETGVGNKKICRFGTDIGALYKWDIRYTHT